MERRLKLLEKLQPTKLNKLTVKQGGVDVKLNLKRDLADPNVVIDEKVLDMLETYVSGQQQTATQASKQTPVEEKEKLADKDDKSSKLTTTTKDVEESTTATNEQQKNDSQVNEDAMTTISSSPTKRVRFESISSIDPKRSSISNPIDDKEKEKENGRSPARTGAGNIIDKSGSDLENGIESSNAQTTTSEEPKQREHSCRLCKLKCTNERSLYEHVTRLHGGKGSFNQQFISKLKSGGSTSAGTSNDNDEDDEEDILLDNNSRSSNNHHKNRHTSMNSDDLDEDVEMTMDESQEDEEASYQSSSSLDISSRKSHPHHRGTHKHHKQPLASVPRPNVAIRVAKVAYYNSKGNASSSNPFKSNIFSNGGLRGNFFSQERLPLKSCKIKMKITSSSGLRPRDNDDDDDDDDDETEISKNEDFLVNTNKLIRLEKLDRNRTLSIQSSHCSADEAHEQLITNKEIRNFFKSLLNYIPQTNPNRLDDLLIEHKVYLSQLLTTADNNIDVNRTLRIVHANVLDAKQFGITLCDLRRKTNEKLLNEKQPQLNINDLTRLLNFLIDYYLVLAVGVVEHVYVCHEFKQHWVIQSYKSLKGRGAFEDSFMYDEVAENETSINNENLDKNETTKTTTEKEETAGMKDVVVEEKQQRPKRGKSVPQQQRQEEGEENVQQTAKNFKQVCLIPRPWRYIDGLLNRPVLKQMLESILIYLKTYPNSSADSICEHYCPALQPVMTIELLEMLERIKCVSKRTLKRQSQCDLFSDFTNGSCEVLDEAELLGNELFVYYLRQNSMFTFKKVFPN